MATIAENLQTIIDIKEDIKEAIIEKGVSVADSDSFSTYANKIGEINNVNEVGFPLYSGVKFSGSGWESAPDVTIVDDLYDGEYMFYKCPKLLTAPQWLSNINFYTIKRMFKECSSLTTLSNLNTTNVTNAQEAFYECSSLTNIPDMDCSKMQNVYGMFYRCYSVTSLGHLTGMGEGFVKSSNSRDRELRLNYFNNLPSTYFNQLIDDLGVCPANANGGLYIPDSWWSPLSSTEKESIWNMLYEEKNWAIYFD